MGWFSGKSESFPAEDVAERLNKLAKKNPKEAAKLMQDIKKGKVPGLSPKERKQVEKDYVRATEGERKPAAVLKAVAADIKAGRGDSKNYQNIPLRDRVHPSEYKHILEREARRQGLL